ncbi:fimbria/pilus periplasmic chaperone [Pantoea sp. R102]|uniref:fimbrial biogenesis chaperone n=1 Tax=Pantoea sp. R102 TaxID=2507583 RepID=UPI0020C085C9|nr:fimbria/pilus periplasmic chaperone [Pantoea sp. R102]
MISGTRVIYPQAEKTISVQLTNEGDSPVLAQSWIDEGNSDASPETLQVPFLLSPPINRIEPKKGQTLRISYTGKALPAGRESVFWLNVLEIPAKAKSADNMLQMAFRTRIKVFFRPSGLKGTPTQAAEQLVWSMSGSQVKAANTSQYHVSLVRVGIKGDTRKPAEGKMISPAGSELFSVPGAERGKTLSIQWVNDYGAIVINDVVIK